jgi:hypothetical protein
MTWLVNPKQRGLALFCCLIGGSLSIVFLSFFAEKANHRSNGFIRLVPPHIAMPANIKDIGYNTFYLAGGTTTHFFLANHVAPGFILSMNTRLKDSTSSRISLHSAGGRFAKALNITIDSPAIYLFEGITPTVVQGRLSDSTLHRIPGKFYFNLATALSPVSEIYRAVDDRQHLNILVKKLHDSVTRGDSILEKQVDGIFCTDGTLHAQADSNRLVYVYHYRNQFICMDTNMRVLFRGRTIDTNTRVKFTVGHIPSQKAFTMSSPPLFVNKESCISGNFLFIRSGLHADNEELTIFQKTSPIDVYSLINGSYLCSFYLPDYHHNKIRDFRICGNTLVALYDHYIYTYTLHLPDKLQK